MNLCSKATGETFWGRKKSARTEENIATVRDYVGHSHRKSVRRRSQELEMRRESVQHVLIFDLHINILIQNPNKAKTDRCGQGKASNNL